MTDYYGDCDDHPDIFDTHVVPKLNGNDVKFFYDVNTESRRAKRSVCLPYAFKIGDFDTTSTISWALERCTEEKELFRTNGSTKILIASFLRQRILCGIAKMTVKFLKVLLIMLPKMVTSSV